jgi:molybdopterin biosynthesis enzyme
MASLLPVDEALARVLKDAAPLPEEWIPVADSDGRVLTRDLVAARSQPPDDVSSMDGYAVRRGPSRTPENHRRGGGWPFLRRNRRGRNRGAHLHRRTGARRR